MAVNLGIFKYTMNFYNRSFRDLLSCHHHWPANNNNPFWPLFVNNIKKIVILCYKIHEFKLKILKEMNISLCLEYTKKGLEYLK